MLCSRRLRLAYAAHALDSLLVGRRSPGRCSGTASRRRRPPPRHWSGGPPPPPTTGSRPRTAPGRARRRRGRGRGHRRPPGAGRAGWQSPSIPTAPPIAHPRPNVIALLSDGVWAAAALLFGGIFVGIAAASISYARGRLPPIVKTAAPRWPGRPALGGARPRPVPSCEPLTIMYDSWQSLTETMAQPMSRFGGGKEEGGEGSDGPGALLLPGPLVRCTIPRGSS